MTNQQLKSHCEDVIANPQEHSEMVLAMAKALLPCLEAKPVFFVEIEGDDWTNSGRIEGDERPDLGLLSEGINHLYSAPPVPELKLPQRMTNPNQLATEGTLWNDCLDVIERLNAPHTAPIEPICATGGAEWVKPVPRELQQVLLELRTYNPKADEHGGKHIIPGWADRIEKALGIKPSAQEEA